MLRRRPLILLLIIALILIQFSPMISQKVEAASGAELENLALGKSYMLSPRNTEAFPDNGNQLTNGVNGGTNAWDTNWVGFNNPKYESNTPIVHSIIVDLGNVASVNTMNANFINDTSVGIYLPEKVSFSVSLDGETWQPIESIELDDESSTVAKKVESDGNSIYTRYVRLDIDQIKEWLLIDEIEVLGLHN